MKQNEFDDFCVFWKATLEMYAKIPSDTALMMVFRSLIRFDLDEIKRALTSHINNPDEGRFIPKPADVVRHIEGDPDSRALSAWSKVEGAISGFGSYQTIVFDEPEIMCALQDMGGWIDLCKMTNDELPFKRNEFVKRYRGYLNQKPEEWPAKLIGVHKMENSAKYPGSVPSPILIGDSQRAHKILIEGGKEKVKSISASQLMTNLIEKMD